MEAFKIENYEREHGQGTFPTCRQLDSRASGELCRRLARALSIADTSSGSEILHIIQDRSHLVEEANAETKDFDLGMLLNHLGLSPAEKVYLNWHQYDDIDEICTADVIAHFADIWYPASDDVDLFDRSMSWVLSITHYGAIRITLMTTN